MCRPVAVAYADVQGIARQRRQRIGLHRIVIEHLRDRQHIGEVDPIRGVGKDEIIAFDIGRMVRFNPESEIAPARNIEYPLTRLELFPPALTSVSVS
jgi:hypothetical protein